MGNQLFTWKIQNATENTVRLLSVIADNVEQARAQLIAGIPTEMNEDEKSFAKEMAESAPLQHEIKNGVVDMELEIRNLSSAQSRM